MNWLTSLLIIIVIIIGSSILLNKKKKRIVLLKLETSLYHTVLGTLQYFELFRCDSGVWQTDGQTRSQHMLWFITLQKIINFWPHFCQEHYGSNFT